jgi:hypothetical protein
MIGINFYMTPEGQHYCEILTNTGRAILWRNFEEKKKSPVSFPVDKIRFNFARF